MSATFKEKKIDVSNSGDNEIVAAVSGKRIRVHSYVLSPQSSVDIVWKDGDGTDLTGTIVLVKDLTSGVM